MVNQERESEVQRLRNAYMHAHYIILMSTAGNGLV